MDAFIDGRDIRTMDDFHRAFAAIEGVPEGFGRNLDALWDTVTGLLNEPLTLTWTNADASAAVLGDNFDVLVGLLLEAEQATASRFKLHLTGAAN